MEFAEACSEIDFILTNLNPEDRKKIPESAIKFFKENKSLFYKVNLTTDKPLSEQDLKDETKAFLQILNEKYFSKQKQGENATEEILGTISNPYSMKNYVRLFNLFLNSKDYHELYSNVVTYFQDGFKEGDVKEVNHNSKFARSEYMNIWHVIRKFSDFFPTEHRIYINAPSDKVGTIVSAFISECDSKKLPFELKYATEQIKRNDSIVIGSNTMAYKKHIEILRKIGEENPEIIQACGTPPLLTGVLDGWIGLADENVTDRFTSYTQSRLQAFTHSVNRFLYDNQDIARKIGAEEIVSIDNTLDSYDMDEEERNEDLQYMLSDTNLSIEIKRKLAEYIKENPETINQIYEQFFIECKRRKIDPEFPIFYEGSRKDLLENEQVPKVDITDEIRKKIVNNSPTIIADMYLKPGIKEKLSIESRVEIIENIVAKEVADRKEEMLMYEDLTFLHKIGFLDDELMAEIDDNLYSDDKIDLINEYLEHQVGANQPDNNKEPLRRYLKSDKDNFLTDEVIRQRINERKQEIIEYFSRPQVLPEKKEQRIEAEEKVLDAYMKDRTCSYATKRALDDEVSLLKADIEHLPEKRETRRKICFVLQGKEFDDSHIKKVREIARPPKKLWDDWEL